MAMKWYVVHTYSGHENKARLSLIERVRQAGLSEQFGEVLIPTETVVEVVKGQKRSTRASSSRATCSSRWSSTKRPSTWSRTRQDHRLPRRMNPTAGQGDRDPEHQHGHHRGDRQAQAAHLVRGGRQRPRHRGPVRELRGRRRGGEAREAEGAGHPVDLRPRDAGRARFRPGREGLRGRHRRH